MLVLGLTQSLSTRYDLKDIAERAARVRWLEGKAPRGLYSASMNEKNSIRRPATGLCGLVGVRRGMAAIIMWLWRSLGGWMRLWAGRRSDLRTIELDFGYLIAGNEHHAGDKLISLDTNKAAGVDFVFKKNGHDVVKVLTGGFEQSYQFWSGLNELVGEALDELETWTPADSDE
jgi:hypothetical protein